MDNLQNKIMQYFHDRLVANGIDPAEIKRKGLVQTGEGTGKNILFTQSIQYSFFNQSRTRGPGETYIILKAESASQIDIEKAYSEMETYHGTNIETRIFTEDAKKFTISIASQGVHSDIYRSGGKAVLNKEGKIEKTRDIPREGIFVRDDDLRVTLKKGESYQKAINVLVDNFCENYMLPSRHRELWKDKQYK